MLCNGQETKEKRDKPVWVGEEQGNIFFKQIDPQGLPALKVPIHKTKGTNFFY